MGLTVAGYRLPVTSYRLPVAVTGYPVNCYRFAVNGPIRASPLHYGQLETINR
jgi:hypothetical protein